MKQDTVNDNVIEGMVKEENLVYELQNQEMIKNPGLTKCFKCNGEGKLKRRQLTLNLGVEEMGGENTEQQVQDREEVADDKGQVNVTEGAELTNEDKFPPKTAYAYVSKLMEEECYMCRGSGETSQ